MRKSKETSNKPQNTTYTIQEMKEAHIAKYQNQSKKKKKKHTKSTTKQSKNPHPDEKIKGNKQ